ncbi:hypothetical protein D3C76_1220880 [compost metagenome]
MPDGVDQVAERRVLTQLRLKQRLIQQAGAGIGIFRADHEHVGDHVCRGAQRVLGFERQWAQDDGLPIDLALGRLGLHQRGDIAVTPFIDASQATDFALQREQR